MERQTPHRREPEPYARQTIHRPAHLHPGHHRLRQDHPGPHPGAATRFAYCGAGCSLLAAQLAAETSGQFRADVKAALDACPRGWVCVGNYSHVQDLVLSQADTVLWLRLPFRVSFWRLCKRTVARAWTQQPLWTGNPNRESWRQSFCSRNSILLYAITSRKMHVETTLRSLGATPHHASVIELRSARAVRRLLERLSQSKPTAPET